jgi:hypothetical protein
MQTFREYADFDFHMHSSFSFDSLQTPKNIIKRSLKCGLSGIAVTDHNTINGALATRKSINDMKCNLQVIIGEEVRTDIGDVIGLFLDKEIESRHFYDMVEEVKGQNGLVVLPHPYKSMDIIPTQVLEKIDAIEVLNGRTPRDLNELAVLISNDHNIPKIAGSDAHFSIEIGRSRTRIPVDIGDISEPEIFIKALRDKRCKLLGGESLGCLTYLGLIIKLWKNGHI